MKSARLTRLCFSLWSALCRGQGPATAPLARGASCQHAAARACGSAREVCAGSHVSRSSPASRYHADASNQELGVARGTLCTVQATVRQSAPTLKVTRQGTNPRLLTARRTPQRCWAQLKPARVKRVCTSTCAVHPCTSAMAPPRPRTATSASAVGLQPQRRWPVLPDPAPRCRAQPQGRWGATASTDHGRSTVVAVHARCHRSGRTPRGEL